MGTTGAEDMELEDWMIFKYSEKEPTMFRKQAEAIEAAANKNELKVFAKEINENGKRIYFVCEPNTFWAWYIHQDSKNYYELLIREKKVKLFYDLEFSIELNGAKNHQEMTKKFIQLIIQYLENVHGVTEPGRNVVVLNSSDSVKYSIHLVFPSIIFEDIRQIKTFNLLMMSSFTEEEKKLFQVQKKDGSNGSFVDNSVYSSHRNMRLFKSSKYNQSRYLKIQQYGHKEFLNNNYIHPNEEKRIFLDSLISNIEEDHIRQIILPTPSPPAEVSRPPDDGTITSDSPQRTPRGRHHNTSIMTEDMESAFDLSACTPMPNLFGEEPMPDQGCASEGAPNASTLHTQPQSDRRGGRQYGTRTDKGSISTRQEKACDRGGGGGGPALSATRRSCACKKSRLSIGLILTSSTHWCICQKNYPEGRRKYKSNICW